MKNKFVELDVDFIGGEKPLTKEEELAISEFIKKSKEKQLKKKSVLKPRPATKTKKQNA